MATAAVGMLAGCQSLQSTLESSESLFGVLTPYKIEIVQGNVVTREQAQAVRPGMTRAQVRDVLGTALVADPFHGDRWDYVFTIRRQGAAPQRRHVVALFEGDRLKSLDSVGGDLPSEREFVASIDTFKPGRTAPSLALTDEQLQALPKPAPSEQAPTAATPPAPARSYPPLEPR